MYQRGISGCRLIARALPKLEVLAHELARGNGDDILGAVERVQHHHVGIGRGHRRELAIPHGVVRADGLELGNITSAQLIQRRFAIKVDFPVVGLVHALSEVNDGHAVALTVADYAA